MKKRKAPYCKASRIWQVPLFDKIVRKAGLIQFNYILSFELHCVDSSNHVNWEWLTWRRISLKRVLKNEWRHTGRLVGVPLFIFSVEWFAHTAWRTYFPPPCSYGSVRKTSIWSGSILELHQGSPSGHPAGTVHHWMYPRCCWGSSWLWCNLHPNQLSSISFAIWYSSSLSRSSFHQVATFLHWC